VPPKRPTLEEICFKDNCTCKGGYLGKEGIEQKCNYYSI
jgi:hypothetical protein